ncbi:MAG TPA: glycosyltransferase [Vicinamibacterales bacterium]|nr:glycosyltransferase [Vicinamibacterales bacterium]
MSGDKPYLSVVICCHNSETLLPRTLAHLANQEVDPSLQWEVVVVDNGSTDRTAEVARTWPGAAKALLRVVREPKLGLSYARARGIQEARGEIISFVDDDNWLCREWVQTAADVMRDHPEAGALGGIVEPEFDGECPAWFTPVAYLYATGPEGEPSGDVTGVHMLCGAGLSVRRSALADIQGKGFRSISVGRQGTGLGAGEDSEMTYCLRLSGWRLRIDPRLRIKHFLPARRLIWSYARRLAYGSAFATPERDALMYACKPPRRGVTYQLRLLRERWFWQMGATLKQLVPAWRGVLKRRLGRGTDGDLDVLQAEFVLGRVNGLLAMRRTYNARAKEIRQVMARMKRQTRG